MIDIPNNITAGEEYSGSCTLKKDDVDLYVESTEGSGCNLTHGNIPQNAQKIDFNLTCDSKNDSYTAVIECHSSEAYCEETINGKITWCFL